ncbi:hypothetical protein GY45DRAFT_65361 [Cubamyces sp. BRFM 1775]|nr:hypothetical protein GY45DRAFT_65361 [Cubamyces sp. BRFM 1775]
MALNAVALNPNRTPRSLDISEHFARTIDTGVEFTLLLPSGTSLPSTGPSTPGSSNESKKTSGKITETGLITFSERRLIFISDRPLDKHTPAFESFVVPLECILSTRYEQPFVGANYLALSVKPTRGGGLPEVESVGIEVRLKGKGIYEFTCALDKARECAIYMRRKSAEEDESLPAYSTPAPSGSSTPYAPGDIPDENPPGYDD